MNKRFKGVIVEGRPVTTTDAKKAGIIKSDPTDRKCKNCLYLIEDNCPESKGPDDYCEYFSRGNQ